MMFSSQEADAFILSMKYLNVSHTILGLLGMCSYIIINPVENIHDGDSQQLLVGSSFG